MSDACLVTLSSGNLSATLPGKVQTYLAAGKPIIASADGETAAVISAANCGFCSAAGDSKSLAENIMAFINTDKDYMQKNALAYYNKYFGKQVFVEKLERILEGK